MQDERDDKPEPIRKKVFKGNSTEQALLKHLMDNFEDQYKKHRDSHIEVLHWKCFNSSRKKSTIVMRYKTSKTLDGKVVHQIEDDTVYIYSKGHPEAIQNSCDKIIVDDQNNTKIFGIKEQNEIEEKIVEMSSKFLNIIMFSQNSMSFQDYQRIN